MTTKEILECMWKSGLRESALLKKDGREQLLSVHDDYPPQRVLQGPLRRWMIHQGLEGHTLDGLLKWVGDGEVTDYEPAEVYASTKSIVEVCVDNRVLPCAARAPELGSFDIKTSEGTYLVLDNYGDEFLPKEVVNRVLRFNTLEHEYTIAIDRNTGAVFVAYFKSSEHKRAYSVILDPLTVAVLPVFQSRLDELRTQKRPYCLGLGETAWRDLWDREIGFKDLREELTVDLCFQQVTLRLHGTAYREMTDWKWET